MKTVLVTGGCGYIDSHTTVNLLMAGYRVVIIDNLANSKKDVLGRIEKITSKKPESIFGDLCDKNTLKNVFSRFTTDSVIHFAGLKASGD